MMIPGSTGDQDAADTIQRIDRAKSGRTNWESFWQEVAQYVLPNYSDTFFTGGVGLTQAQKKDLKRYSGKAEVALQRFSASMESMLTPRNSRWHTLQVDDTSLSRKPRVAAWFDDATDALFKYRYDPRANFASQCHEHYQSLGAFGTGALYTDKLTPKGFRYAEIHIAQVYFYENHQGIVDEAYREFKLTARQAVAKFTDMAGRSNLPAEIIKSATTEPERQYSFIHCVKPNEAREPKRLDYRGKKFVSYYVSRMGQATVLREGFNAFPYAISRYVTAPGELYGRSPAMQALTNIKVLNEQKKTVLKQGHRIVDPVLLAHDDGILDSFSLRPGAINTGAMSADGKRLVDVLPTGNLAVAQDMMEAEGKEIDAAFLVDLFQILVDGPQMTATEVLERAREKGALLSPTMGRQQSEFLGPLIERELDLAISQGILPPMPPELVEAGADYKVVYDSPLSRAQRAEQAAGLMRTVQFAAEIAQQTQDPTPLDHFNWDVIIPELSAIQAVPMRWMKSAQQLKDARDARSQQVATQQLIDAGPTVAALAKTTTGAK